jgi:formiminotetrahydrofolate cyclodeaminase
MRHDYRKDFYDYLQTVSSRGAYGGGSAAGLNAALAAALVLKVLNYTLAKVPGKDPAELKRAQQYFKTIQQNLSVYIDKDAELFSAYLRERDAGKKQKRLERASAGISEVMEDCREAIKRLEKLRKKTYKNLRSDLKISVLFFKAATRAGQINLAANELLRKKKGKSGKNT